MADPSLQTPLLQQSEILSCLGIGSIQTHLQLLPAYYSCTKGRNGNPPAATPKQKEIPAYIQPACISDDHQHGLLVAETNSEGREFSISVVLKLSMSFFFVYSAMNALSGYVTSVLPDELGDLSLFMLQSTLCVSALAAPKIVATVGELRGMMIGGMAHALYFTALTQPRLRWLVLAASAVCGFGSSLTWVAHGTFLTRCSPPTKRGFYAGVFWGIYYLAGIAGNLASFLVFGRLSDAAMFGVGAASATFGVILLLFIPDPPRRTELVKTPDLEVQEKPFHRFDAGSLVLLLLLAPMIFYSGSNGAFRTAEFTKLLPTHAIGAVLVFTGFGQVIGSFFLSWLSDVIQYGTPTFLIGFFCTAIGLFICPTLQTDSSSSSPVVAHDPNGWPLIFNIPLLAFLGGLSFGIADGVITSHMFAMFGRAFQGHGPFVWAIFNLVSNAGAAATYSMGILLPMQRQYDTIYTQLWVQAILVCSGAPLYIVVDTFSLHRLPFKFSSREAAAAHLNP